MIILDDNISDTNIENNVDNNALVSKEHLY